LQLELRSWLRMLSYHPNAGSIIDWLVGMLLALM
jgi:hypothetical protein